MDLDENPLLYEYYANTLNPIIDKRNFDEIDRLGMDDLDKRAIYKRSSEDSDGNGYGRRPGSQLYEIQFNENDINGMDDVSGAHKASLSFDRQFDGIDADGLGGLAKARKNKNTPNWLRTLIWWPFAAFIWKEFWW